MSIWKFCKEQLLFNNRVALLIIIETKGSSPGKVGFKMAVSENGQLKGSVGGGSAEYAAVEMAKAVLRDVSNAPVLKKQIHTENTEDSSGMICSGEQTFVILPLNEDNLPDLNKLEQAENKPEAGCLLADENGLHFFTDEKCTSTVGAEIKSETNWKYQEPIGLKETIYIFGGGHVSLELSKVMQMLGFYVKVFDSRSDISTMKANTAAHEKIVIPYDKAGEQVTENENTYVVIMTVGHQHDLEVLEQMVGKKIRYLGMMGSRSKVTTIHKLMREKGFSEQEISKIHMPIGLPIKSHTPMEIAISISAEIIKVKND
jgi:xanthine dehydrogenase accessory factor